MIKLDFNKILTSVIAATLGALLVFSVGAAVEFQDMKKTVADHGTTISVVSKLLCSYAIRDNIEQAKEICTGVIK